MSKVLEFKEWWGSYYGTAMKSHEKTWNEATKQERKRIVEMLEKEAEDLLTVTITTVPNYVEKISAGVIYNIIKQIKGVCVHSNRVDRTDR